MQSSIHFIAKFGHPLVSSATACSVAPCALRTAFSMVGQDRHGQAMSKTGTTRHRQERHYITGAALFLSVFAIILHTQCLVSRTTNEIIPLVLCENGRELSDPRCLSLRNTTLQEPAQLAATVPITGVTVPPSLIERVDAAVLVTNAPEHTARRIHFEELIRDVGCFRPVRFEPACLACKEGDVSLLSHMRALVRVSQEAHDRFVLIFEDVVELAQQLDRSMFLSALDHEIQHVLRPNDGFAYLGVCLDSTMEKECTYRTCTPFGLHAYMVTPWGARKILRSIEATHGKYSPDSYIGKSIGINEFIGPSPTIGWNYTHSHTFDGWRGMFYQARKAPWYSAPPDTTAKLKVKVAHSPKNDLLGSFVTPTLFLYAITEYHGWQLGILPFAGSDSEQTLKENFALGNSIDSSWGSGFVDASNRPDYNPVQLNTDSYDTMGFFPPISNDYKQNEWISMNKLPLPGDLLKDECRKHNETYRANNQCNILLPEDPYVMENHMTELGGYDVVFTTEFRSRIRATFLEKNAQRLRHYKEGGYNVAIHIRRGDILADYRWIEQSVFANLARQICRNHPEAKIHVFSSGKNRDGNWTTMESITTEDASGSKCASVALHLDELEFDTWTHMVAADAFIMSKSNFGLIPSLLCGGEVYFPSDYWHLRLSSFRLFNSATGEIIQ
jgi:hypothetical protein